MPHEDTADYYHFTGPQRFDKAIHTLDGIVRGVGADGKVSDEELGMVMRWIGEYREFSDRHPFNEVIPLLNSALMDGVFDAEERYDVLWLCERLSTGNTYFDDATADMQRLQGILAGIVADQKIESHELRHLQAWMEEHTDLKTCWPYDEIEAMLLTVLKDGGVDQQEHAALMAFFGEFAARPGHRAIDNTERAAVGPVQGICAVCPEVVFADRIFCFTGSSERAPRKTIEAQIVDLGGRASKSVIRALNYLVIGTAGNPCWAYACYGRKVEQAVALRREGLPIVMVHENDFWDAVQDA